MSWTLPGRNHTSTLKATLARSSAYSRTFNRRNLEYMWYPLWCHTLVDLVSDLPNVLVAPQYPLYVTRDDRRAARCRDDDEGCDATEDDKAVDGETPESVVRPTTPQTQQLAVTPPLVHTASGIEYEDDDDDFEQGNLSMSTTATRAEPGADSVLVDYALVHVVVRQINEGQERYGGWKVMKVNVPVLVEEKRLCSRTLSGAALHSAICTMIGEAQIDTLRQAAIQFTRDESVLVITAIAASGPYWTIAKLERKHVKKVIYNLLQLDEGKAIQEKATWEEIRRLDTEPSDNRLRLVHEELARLPGLPVLM